jgi:uncharacterized protein YdaU (DUF1376 family)
MHYYQHHIGDFIKDTSFLTNEEVGIYMKLLWLYYDSEQPLSNSLFELSMKVNARDQQDLLAGILGMFFKLKDDKWWHTRCDKEIDHYHQQLETASKAGKASAAKRALNRQATTVERPLDSGSTIVQLTMNHEPITNNHKPKKSATSVACPSNVNQQVWNDWLTARKGKGAKTLTETAWARFKNQVEKAGWGLEQAISHCCLKNWVSFEAEWVAPKQAFANKFDVSHVTTPPPPNQDAALRKIEEDLKNAKPPSLEVLAKMAQLRKSMA